MPERVQLKRTKGWKMPANTVKVDRSTKWGNPFRIYGQNEHMYCDASHRRTILTPWVVFDHTEDPRWYPVTPEKVLEAYSWWLHGEFDDAGIVRPCHISLNQLKDKLRGKNLACWCKLTDKCHADVLLKLANS